jgi:hypothetical protein
MVGKDFTSIGRDFSAPALVLYKYLFFYDSWHRMTACKRKRYAMAIMRITRETHNPSFFDSEQSFNRAIHTFYISAAF